MQEKQLLNRLGKAEQRIVDLYKKLTGKADAGGEEFALPYKVYTAVLTPAGTNPPVARVLQNTMLNPVVITRDSIGTYSIQCEDFLYLKTHLLTNFIPVQTTPGGMIVRSITLSQNGGNAQVSITTIITGSITSVGTLIDNLGSVSVEIRVYN